MKETVLHRFGALLLALAILISLALPALAADAAATPTEIKLDQTKIKIDVRQQIVLSITNFDEFPENTVPIWTMSRTGIVREDAQASNSSRVLTGYDAGVVTVTVRIGLLTASCEITVYQPVTEIRLSSSSLTLKKTEETTLAAVLKPDNASEEYCKGIKWKSNNENVVTVDQDGKVKPVGAGTAIITVEAYDKDDKVSASATCRVTVLEDVAASEITLTNTTLKLQEEETGRLMFTVIPENAVVLSSEWKSSDETVAVVEKVSADGTGAVIVAKKAGTAEISVTIKTRDATGTESTISTTRNCTVTVEEKPNSGDPGDTTPTDNRAVSIDPSRPISVTVGESIDMTATVENATEDQSTEIVWSSSNEEVATVDENGTVTTKKAGSAEIKATLKDKPEKYASCKVTVKPAPEEPDGTLKTILLSPSVVPDFASKDAKSATISARKDPLEATETLKWTIVQVEGGLDPAKVISITPSEDGLSCEVKPVGPGEAIVKVSATTEAGREITAERLVRVSGILLSESGSETRDISISTSLAVSGTKNLAATYFGNAKSGAIQWSSDDNSIVSVSGGRLTARAIGTATVTVTRGGYTAECKVTVTENTVGVIKDEAEAGKPYDFSDILNQLNRVCQSATTSKASLSYLTNLSVAPEQGVLYYNYVSPEDTGLGVGNTEKYYYSDAVQGERHISGVTFVPNPEFSGTATIRYTGFSTARETFSGTILLDVEGVNDVIYATILNTPVTFKAADFNTICKVRTGRELNYVTFTLPQPKQGTLYFNYAVGSLYAEKVASATKYYRDRSPSVGEISFMPADDYAGTVTISYRATDTSGASFNGEVTIRVNSRNTAGVGDVNYLANQGEPVTFQISDFNSVCRTAVGETLDYVRFTPPESSTGVLYYNYQGNGSYGSVVKADDRYYRSGSPAIDAVTFVPASGSSAPVTISFSGYGSRGTRFDGTIVIQYTETSSGNTVTYTIRSGRYVRFDVADFNELCQSVTGSNLNYVQFDLPPASLGRLYYGYDVTRDNYADVVSSSASYYRTGRNLLIDNVSFVAAMGCTGTVEIPFTGRSAGSREFNGMVRIQVLSATPEPLRYTTISGPVQLTAADFQRVCGRLLTGELSYVQFNSLPASSAGVMYSGYTALGTGNQAAAGIVYYASGSPSLDQLCFVPRAGFSGTVSFDYTAQDVNGGWVHGTGEIVVTNSGSSYFTDLGNHVWAAPAADFLFQTEVANGIAPGRFGPGHQIKRGDFVLMLCRAFRFNTGSKTSFPDVNGDMYYANAVATAKDLGITNGSNGYFLPESPLTRQDAMVMIRRAMQAAGWNLTAADHSYLGGFADGAYISIYARDAVASMVQMGVVNGNAGLLNPTEQITRAEMAVILHRVLTL